MQNRPEGPLNWFGKELNTEAFLQTMVEQQRLVYEFQISRAYGMV
jgi:hypothetical protein